MKREATALDPDGAFRRSPPAAAVLGLLGWVGAGPLVATILVGRTALFFPSARWLLACLVAWVLSAAAGWGAAAWSVAGRDPSLGATRFLRPAASPRQMITRAAGALALLAAAVPLLAVLYADDAAYHLVAGGTPAARRGLLAYLALLAAGGAAARFFLSRVPHVTAREVSPAPAALPEGASWGAVPLLGVLLMAGANGGLLYPLQALLPASPTFAALAVLNLLVSVVAVAWGSFALAPHSSSRWLALVAATFAWVAFVPWQEALAAGEPIGFLLLLGASGLVLLRTRSWLAGALLGALAGFAPPAGGALVALAALGRWRAGAAGLLVAALVVVARAVSGQASAVSAAAVRAALAGTAHEANAALGGLHARLFLGAGFLTAPNAPAPAPAAALTLGVLFTGGLLAFSLAQRASRAETAGPSVLCVGLVAGLLLAGTSPHAVVPLCLLAVFPFLRPALWQQVTPGLRVPLALLAVAGYVLAGTSLALFARAGAEVVSAWPPLASLPALGLALLAAALAAAVAAESAVPPPEPSVSPAAPN